MSWDESSIPTAHGQTPSTPPRACRFCGCSVQEALHRHHVRPQSDGGDDRSENLVTLCVSCHRTLHRLYGTDALAESTADLPPDQGPAISLDHDGTEEVPCCAKDRRLPPQTDHVTYEPYTERVRLSDVRDGLDVPESFAPLADEGDRQRWVRALAHVSAHREEVLGAFDEEDQVVYALESDEPRTTPLVLVVDDDRDEYRVDEGGTGDYPDHHYRIHCSYCRAVFTCDEHANAAAHLRRHHGIEEPYEPTRPRVQSAADAQPNLPGREKMKEIIHR